MIFSPAPASRALEDRIGGAPSHLPPQVPACPTSDAKMGFLAQFVCAAGRLELPGAIALQLYQCRGVDDGDDPTVVAMAVPIGAPENVDGLHAAEPWVIPHAIAWEWREERDPNDESAGIGLFAAKAGGKCPFADHLPSGATFLLQLKEDPGHLNFAGRLATVFLRGDGTLGVELT
jgi:hypothetical protein